MSPHQGDQHSPRMCVCHFRDVWGRQNLKFGVSQWDRLMHPPPHYVTNLSMPSLSPSYKSKEGMIAVKHMVVWHMSGSSARARHRHHHPLHVSPAPLSQHSAAAEVSNPLF